MEYRNVHIRIVQIAKAKEEHSKRRQEKNAFGTNLSCAVKISINTKYARSDSAQSIWGTAYIAHVKKGQQRFDFHFCG